MYCVKCGVSLEDGSRSCPLCGTPVWNPENTVRNTHYNPELYPELRGRGHITPLALISMVFIIIPLACLIACLNYYGQPAWSAYVIAGFVFLYIAAVLPSWLPRYNPVIFIPVSFAALELLLWFINLYTGGNWFLSFAFPVAGILFIFVYLAFWLGRIGVMPRIKLRLLGIYFILLGAATMLIEFFMHISFSLPMFNWSLFSASVLGAFGLFLFVASFILRLRRAMYKKMFV